MGREMEQAGRMGLEDLVNPQTHSYSSGGKWQFDLQSYSHSEEMGRANKSGPKVRI